MDAQMIRYMQVALTTVLVYNCVLSLDNEVSAVSVPILFTVTDQYLAERSNLYGKIDFRTSRSSTSYFDTSAWHI
ncbi:hypothetical protein EDD16DRAFT_1624604 [Pisolithus croceorrhizus]|nr:hypothetical protein EDD16DRAFT_1624604 [Pisolithus croceorrhizus]